MQGNVTDEYGMTPVHHSVLNVVKIKGREL